MIQRTFDVLFVMALVAPPIAVVVGMLLLAIRPRRQHVGHAAQPAHA